MYGGYVNVSYFNQYVIQFIIKSNSTKFGLQDSKDTSNITLSHFECQSLIKFLLFFNVCDLYFLPNLWKVT